MSRRFRLVVRLMLAAAAVLLLVTAVHILTGLGGSEAEPIFVRWVYNPIFVLCSAICLWRALCVERKRLSWWLMGIGLSVWTAGNIVYFGVGPHPSETRTVVAEVLWLGMYPLVYVAIGLAARERLRRLGIGLWLDGLSLALALGALGNALLIERTLIHLAGVGTSTAVVEMAFPLADVMLVVMIAGVLTLHAWRVNRTWWLLGAGFVTFAITDAIYAEQSAASAFVAGSALDLGWMTGALLLAAAAAVRVDPVVRARDRGGAGTVAAPVVAGACLTGVLVAVALGQKSVVSVSLCAAGLAVVIVRIAITLMQNDRLLDNSRKEASTDALTGLGNRRQLVAELEDALAHVRAVPAALAIFDLDGFKGYNDAFGHLAGDALLTRVGRAMQSALGDRGSAYRMGGDEFCALVRAEDEREADIVVARIAAAMRQHGEGFDVTASFGAAWLVVEMDASAALGVADQRMYTAKHSGARSARRQTADVLRAVTRASRPELSKRSEDVGELAAAVARRLRVPDREADDIREAGRLHDIGKIAVPSALLDKQGPLDADEWKFVRRHTVIGERILVSAPALARVGRIVRASHERWDGYGYPDGLAGAEIPLGARIVFACDAYHAMTQDRPYQAARTSEASLGELRRCSGSQFDPDVVAALAHVVGCPAGALAA